MSDFKAGVVGTLLALVAVTVWVVHTNSQNTERHETCVTAGGSWVQGQCVR